MLAAAADADAAASAAQPEEGEAHGINFFNFKLMRVKKGGDPTNSNGQSSGLSKFLEQDGIRSGDTGIHAGS